MKTFARQNELEITVEQGRTCYFQPKYLRSTGFARDFVPPGIGGFLPRLFGGRLWDLHFCPSDGEKKVVLSGDDGLGKFECLNIPEGKTLCVKLKYLAAYSFESKGRFKGFNIRRLFRPVNWLTSTVFVLRVTGPAFLAFYGNDISKKTIESRKGAYGDQLIAVDANASFHPDSLSPDDKSLLAQFMNSLSKSVYLRFADNCDVVYSTLRTENLTILTRLPMLVLGVLTFSFFIRNQILALFGLQ